VPPSRFSGRGVLWLSLDTGMIPHPDRRRTIVAQSFGPVLTRRMATATARTALGTACGPCIRRSCRATASLMVPRSSSAKCQHAGQRIGRSIPRGINWASQQVPVISMSARATLTPVCVQRRFEGRRPAPWSRQPDHRGGGQRQSSSWNHSPGEPSGELSLDHASVLSMRICRWRVLHGGICGTVVAGRHRGTGVKRLLHGADAETVRSHECTKHGPPHVAGCARCIARKPHFTGAALWRAVTSAARPLPLPSRTSEPGSCSALNRSEIGEAAAITAPSLSLARTLEGRFQKCCHSETANRRVRWVTFTHEPKLFVILKRSEESVDVVAEFGRVSLDSSLAFRITKAQSRV